MDIDAVALHDDGVDRSNTVDAAKVQLVVDGVADYVSLNAAERATADAQIDAAISARARAMSGAFLRAALDKGGEAVALGDDEITYRYFRDGHVSASTTSTSPERRPAEGPIAVVELSVARCSAPGSMGRRCTGAPLRPVTWSLPRAAVRRHGSADCSRL